MKTKKCPKCLEPKPISEFSKDRSRTDGLQIYCKEHKNKMEKDFHKKYPWKRVLQHIKDRCENPNNWAYQWYGKRGIKNYLTEEDVKFLMIRDGYWNMKKPSIDREKSNKNYTLKNCRFIEQAENSAKDLRKIVLQFDLDGNFIKKWNSTVEVERKLSIHNSHISKCCNNKQKTAGKFIWKYKNERH